MLRIDPPEPLTTDPSFVGDSPQPRHEPPATARQHGQWAAWLIALAGATMLGVGLGLLFWSLTNAIPELWGWGIGATLGGQGLLIIGLVQLIASLWTVNRESAGALRGVQQELRRLGQTTQTLVGAKNTGAANFYADLARGASPQVLLANLRGQVDALTSHVAER